MKCGNFGAVAAHCEAVAMNDIVSGENLPHARGIKAAVAARTLKNFRSPKNQAEARADCRVQHALLYSPGYGFDDGVFKDLSKHSGAVVFSFSDICGEKGFRRAIMLSKMRLALDSCRKSGCGFVVCTLAKDENALRNARELEAFMAVLGMNGHEKAHAEECMEKMGFSRIGASDAGSNKTDVLVGI